MKKNFGIIGNPVKHSLSPVLHNYWFEKYKIDANYSLISIEENNLNEIVEKIKNQSLHGVNGSIQTAYIHWHTKSPRQKSSRRMR